jgi:hypothetical protein
MAGNVACNVHGGRAPLIVNHYCGATNMHGSACRTHVRAAGQRCRFHPHGPSE